MKKITTTLLMVGIFAPVFVFAQEPVTNTPTTGTPVVTSLPATPPVSCIVKAYDVRETSVIAAFDVFNTSVKQALQIRKDSMIIALSASDKKTRKTLRLESRNTFDITMKAARNVLKASRTKAQEVFKSDAKVCGKTAEITLEGFKEESSLPSINK